MTILDCSVLDESANDSFQLLSCLQNVNFLATFG